MPLTSQDQQKAIVAAHNAYRGDPAIHAPDLTWEKNLAEEAQKWADNLATNVHTLKHSSNPKDSAGNSLGENIASAWSINGGRLLNKTP